MNIRKKHSYKRDAIFEALLSSKDHPSAEAVYLRLKADIPDLSLGTVYRNLSVFRSEGLAVTVANVNGEDRFDADMSEHPHFICESCGAVTDVDSRGGHEDFEYVNRKYGVVTTRRRLLYYGKCANCLTGI